VTERSSAASRRSRGVLAALLAAACSDPSGPNLTLTIEAPASSEILVGDFLTLTVASTEGAPSVTWSSDDEYVAGVADGVVEARRPGRATIGASAPGTTPAEITLTVVPRPGGYAADEIDYFTAIAFGAEIGDSSPFLRRWRSDTDLAIRVNGAPTPDDLVMLDAVLAEISRLTPLQFEIVDDLPAVEVHFVPRSQFQTVLPQAQTGSDGFVWAWWAADDHFTSCLVLIATDLSQSLRDHVIREEVTQMLGLLQDSFLYPESIFYRSPSIVTEYLPIDRAVIELLYRVELAAGMTSTQAEQMARTLTRSGSGVGAEGSMGFQVVGSGLPGQAGSSSRPPAPANTTGSCDTQYENPAGAATAAPAGPSPYQPSVHAAASRSTVGEDRRRHAGHL
jgi:hypothetical protein